MGSVNQIIQANNTTRMNRAKYDAARLLQGANNNLEAKRVALAEFSRSLGNNMRQTAAGKEFNEATSQIAAALEGRTTNRINASLAASERIGALSAQAGALGVGGSSVDLLNSTIKLQRNIEQDLAALETKRMASAGGRANAQIMANANNTLDLTRHMGSFDHTIHMAPKDMKNQLATGIGIAVATYFGGPQAGEAVADAAVGQWQMANGNFQGGINSIDSALANGVKGYQTWSSLQGGDGPSSWFGAVTQKRQQTEAKAEANNQNINWGGLSGQEDMGYGSDFGANWDKFMSSF